MSNSYLHCIFFYDVLSIDFISKDYGLFLLTFTKLTENFHKRKEFSHFANLLYYHLMLPQQFQQHYPLFVALLPEHRERNKTHLPLPLMVNH